jgi:hypothetical protein
MSQQMHAVFISSTSRDLQSYREVAAQEILKMGWHAEMMEAWGSSPDETVKACCDKLMVCDAVLLIVAFQQGWVPSVEQGGNGKDSITALEFEFAKAQKKPVLVMFAKETSWPSSLCDHTQEKYDWIIHFRANINRMAEFFDYEEERKDPSERLPNFGSKVRRVLMDHKAKLLPQAGPLKDFETAQQRIVEGNFIPLIGAGIYAGGPLSDEALLKALPGGNDDSHGCLATAAQYYEQKVAFGRQPFLEKLREIIVEQSNAVQTNVPAFYKMLLKVKPPSLIVSTTRDLILEEFLGMNGKTYNIICHVIRSLVEPEEHAGEILIFSGKPPKEIKPDAKLQLDLELKEIDSAKNIQLEAAGPADFTIYKPLGSPLLLHPKWVKNDLVKLKDTQANADLELDTLDSTVMTEADLPLFLGRLEHEETCTPAGLKRLLRKQPLFVAGYHLDSWNYRFAMYVFQSTRSGRSLLRNLAARIPKEGSMETLAWQGLGTDLIALEPNDFANRVLAGLQPSQQAGEEASHAN